MHIPPGTVELRPAEPKKIIADELKIPASVESVAPRALMGARIGLLDFPKDSKLSSIQCEAFRGSQLEAFAAPASLRTISQGAFAECASLRTATLNDGLESLGADEYGVFRKRLLGVFQNSGLAGV